MTLFKTTTLILVAFLSLSAQSSPNTWHRFDLPDTAKDIDVRPENENRHQVSFTIDAMYPDQSYFREFEQTLGDGWHGCSYSDIRWQEFELQQSDGLNGGLKEQMIKVWRRADHEREIMVTLMHSCYHDPNSPCELSSTRQTVIVFEYVIEKQRSRVGFSSVCDR